MDIKLTFDLLPALAVLISLLAWAVPGFKDWYKSLELKGYKQLVMIGAMAGIVLVAVALSALGFVDIYKFETWREWVWYPLVDFVIAVLANTGTYSATGYIFNKK